MGRFTQILRSQDGEQPQDIKEALDLFENTQAAPDQDYKPIPKGDYVVQLVPQGSGLFRSKSGTKGYKLELQVAEGVFEGRRLWFDLWLTPDAVSITKRELGRIGIAKAEQLESPIPVGIRVRVRVVIEQDDKGNLFNRVRTILEFVGIAPADPFAPTSSAPASPAQPTPESASPRPAGEQRELPF